MFGTGVSSTRRQYWIYWTVVLLMFLGAGFRLIALGHEALSGDELFSRRVALQSLTAGYAEVRDDLVHPPFYYLLLKAGTSIWGANALGLRSLSLLCGIASIGLIALLGRRLPDARWCGLLAAAGMAVGRYQVFYSQEARSYALYTMLVLLLILWVEAISKLQRNLQLWLAGAGLMLLLVYTHYVGSLYVMAAVLALLACKLESRTKVLAVAAATTAALLFTPWLLAVSTVYKRKHGVGDNLDWQGHPSLYDLKMVWATGLGVMDFPGATTAAICLILALGVAALVLVSRKQTLRQSPVVVALLTMAVLPPAILFLLSNPPFNLPLFGLRHLLPSTAVLLLLSCYGLERLSQASARRAPLVALCGAALILVFGAAPTVKALRAGPTRYSYDLVERRVEAVERDGTQAFAASFYMEAEPVNFYCKSSCVQALPEDKSQLPAHLLLLYRPRVAEEENKYRQLTRSGYVDVDHVLYSDGLGTPWGTMVASLELRK
jgi:4-amino-4-deoxy-L-arabinose transferase-like glycosyltransferase